MSEWRKVKDVLCVECPNCLFIFAAARTDGDSGEYSCPRCDDGAQPSVDAPVCKHCRKRITRMGGAWFHVGEPVSDAISCKLVAQPISVDANGLLPCPFCGSAAESAGKSGNPATLDEYLSQRPNVRCSDGKCAARYIPGGMSFDEWNTRSVVEPEASRLLPAALEILDYLNFDTVLEDVRGDAPEIAAIITKHISVTPDNLAEVRAQVDKLLNSDFVCSRCGSQKKDNGVSVTPEQNQEAGRDAGPTLPVITEGKTVSPPLATEPESTALCQNCGRGIYNSPLGWFHSYSGDGLCVGVSARPISVTPEPEAEYRRGVETAVKIAELVKEDSESKLGLVPGNVAFENGRLKASVQIINQCRALIPVSSQPEAEEQQDV